MTLDFIKFKINKTDYITNTSIITKGKYGQLISFKGFPRLKM